MEFPKPGAGSENDLLAELISVITKQIFVNTLIHCMFDFNIFNINKINYLCDS